MRKSIVLLPCALLMLGGLARADEAYLLGPDDELTIRVPDLKEVGAEPYRIDLRGDVNVPLAGRVHAAGLTLEQLEAEIANRLKEYLHEPGVSVSIHTYGSQPVSILGAVNSPGVHQIRGRMRLFEVLSAAGGLKNEAGNSLKITRRKESGPIPLPNARADASGDFSIAEVSVKSVMEAREPGENILIRPNDVISVPRAEFVYVIGSVKRAGAFPLNEREAISVLQALSLAEGTDSTAAPANAKILREQDGLRSRLEIPINIKKLMAGRAEDLSLKANDILFVPNSATRSATMRGIEAAIQLGTGVLVWRR